MAVSMKIQPRFCPKYTQKNIFFEALLLNPSESALRITCRNFRSKNEKLDPETRILCRSSWYLDFVLGISCTRYLLIENELGGGEDVDRLAILQGVFTPSLSVVRRAHFSDYRIGFSISNLRAWRDCSSMDFLNENEPVCTNYNFTTCGARSAKTAAKFGVTIYRTCLLYTSDAADE